MPIYLYLDILVIAFPLLLSFDKKVAYFKTWKYLFPAILIIGAFFVLWDMQFTRMNIWSFNEKYLLGIYMYNLPIEEVLFFIVVPFSCVFIYEVLKAYFPKDIFAPYVSKLNIAFLLLFALFGIIHWDKIYTLFQCLLLVIMLVLHIWVFKATYMGRFYATFFISLIPFMIMNGYLTSLPIVIYNNAFNSGIRISTIPLEDSFYCFLLLLMNISLVEYLKRKFAK